MKNLLHHLLIPIVLLSFFSFANANNEKKKITNKLYSFSVPVNWECAYPGKAGDCFDPSEFLEKQYRRYWLAWRSPVRSDEDFFKAINIIVRSYERLDKQPISIEEIEDSELKTLKSLEDIGVKISNRKDIKAKANQKRFTIKKITKGFSVEKGEITLRGTTTYLLQKNGDIVHLVNIFVVEDQYLLPETQKIINEILDSFKVK